MRRWWGQFLGGRGLLRGLGRWPVSLGRGKGSSQLQLFGLYLPFGQHGLGCQAGRRRDQLVSHGLLLAHAAMALGFTMPQPRLLHDGGAPLSGVLHGRDVACWNRNSSWVGEVWRHLHGMFELHELTTVPGSPGTAFRGT